MNYFFAPAKWLQVVWDSVKFVVSNLKCDQWEKVLQKGPEFQNLPEKTLENRSNGHFPIICIAKSFLKIFCGGHSLRTFILRREEGLQNFELKFTFFVRRTLQKPGQGSVECKKIVFRHILNFGRVSSSFKEKPNSITFSKLLLTVKSPLSPWDTSQVAILR